MTQYELWWAVLPPPAGRRPVLLLSRPDSYAYLNKVVCAEITTTIRGIPVEVRLGRRNGLDRLSVANCDNIRTVPKAALSARIGVLEHHQQTAVKRAVGYALAWEELIRLST